MSPEQADGGKEVDSRSDLWSLAVVTFRCLTGVAPFDGDGVGQILLKVMTAPIPAPRDIQPTLPAAVNDWWFRVIQRDPSQRPASALALAKGLREALAGAAQHTPGAPDPKPRSRSRDANVESPQAASLQPTLHPTPRQVGLSSRPLQRYAIGAVTLLVLLAWMLVRSGSASNDNDRQRPAVSPTQALGDESGSARPAAASMPDSLLARRASQRTPAPRADTEGVTDKSTPPETTLAALEPHPARPAAPSSAVATTTTNASSGTRTEILADRVGTTDSRPGPVRARSRRRPATNPRIERAEPPPAQQADFDSARATLSLRARSRAPGSLTGQRRRHGWGYGIKGGLMLDYRFWCERAPKTAGI